MENNNAPKVNATLLYEIVADMMPMEGRDFTLTVDNAGGKPTVEIKALTDIGRMFAPLLAKRLEKPMSDTGVSVSGDGVAEREVMTIRSIREKVEAEAAAARRAKIEAAKAHAATKREVFENTRKARVTAQGEKAPESSEERKARLDMEGAANALKKLTMLDSRIGKVRTWVDEQAKRAATEDTKAGRSWAVDMDAPLNTQFDMNDVKAKFTTKENLISRMAEYGVEQDYLGWQAINVAKQYIIQKQ